MGVPSTEIADRIRACGLEDVDSVSDATSAGTACGTCHAEIREILAALAGRPVSPADRAANEKLCRSETERRVDGALQSWAAARLPPDHRAELQHAIGLDVSIRVEGSDAEAQHAPIREALHKRVCHALRICFS